MKKASVLAVAPLLLAASLVLSGCASSPPARFITLAPLNPGAAPITLSGPPIRLGHVELPDAVDQPYLVTASGPNTRDVSNTLRWIAPLDRLVRSTLQRDLSRRLKPGSFVAGPQHSGAGRMRVLDVNIESFIARGSQIELDASWTLTGSGSTPDKSRKNPSAHARIHGTVKTGRDGAIAAAMSQALAKLADRIVEQLQTVP